MRKGDAMRAMAMLLMMGLALAALSGEPARAQSSSGTGAARPALGGAAATAPDDAGSEEIIRTMYVTMGAMAGYMFAVMPVTMTAVTAAVASGAASMWAYDYVLGPAAKAGQPTP